GDDAQLALGLEPALDAVERVRDDGGAAGGELEESRRGRRLDFRVRAPRRVHVDARGRDGVREDVERDAAEPARGAEVAAVVVSADGEIDVFEPAARLADQLAHPLAPELVGVAVEEDVRLLL